MKNSLTAILVDDAGNIYVLDIKEGHIKKFDAGGKEQDENGFYVVKRYKVILKD